MIRQMTPAEVDKWKANLINIVVTDGSIGSLGDGYKTVDQLLNELTVLVDKSGAFKDVGGASPIQYYLANEILRHDHVKDK